MKNNWQTFNKIEWYKLPYLKNESLNNTLKNDLIGIIDGINVDHGPIDMIVQRVHKL
jgi:hypothetical protein